MRKTTIIMFIVVFLTGLLVGILMLDDIPYKLREYALYLYLFVIIGSLVFVNIKYQRKKLQIYMFFLASLIMYFPVNILAGVYFSHNQWRYFAGFPRFIIILYYLLFLLTLYLIARGIDFLTKSKRSKIIYIITDILSLSALPILLFVTYFSSPA